MVFVTVFDTECRDSELNDDVFVGAVVKLLIKFRRRTKWQCSFQKEARKFRIDGEKCGRLNYLVKFFEYLLKICKETVWMLRVILRQ